MATELYIIGSSGLAKECAQLARQVDSGCNRWSSVSYVTHNANLLGEKLPFGCVEMLDNELVGIQREVDVVLGIGHPNLRQKLCQKFLTNSNINFPNIIHPSVEIDDELVKVGYGNIITKGVILTCDIKIGNFNLLNWNVTIGHDSELGNYNVINPGSCISGCVRIVDACLIGTGVQVIEGVQIGSNIIIGAGAVVTRSIEKAGIYTGIPARLRE